ncbi:hypothetical protein [Flavobacterium sp.]
MANPKVKKIDKEYCITDGSVNVYKYRLLTEGFLVDEFKKNPIGFLMHNRDKGVVIRWEDFRTDGDKVFAKPVINLSHPDGEKTVNDIENGFLNAASVGKIVCLDASDDKNLMLPGQTGLTITEWFPREISLVDIPGNYNALANLYDINDNEIELADLADKLESKKNPNMKKIILTAALLNLMDLTEKSTDQEAETKLQDLADLAAKVPGLEKDLSDKSAALTAKETELNAKQTELSDLKASTITKQVADLVAQGQTDKKLTVEVAKKLEVAYATNPEGLKDLIAAMPAQTSVAAATTEGDVKDLAAFEGKKWDDLYATDQLQLVKTKFPDLYEKLKKEKYPNLKD